MRTGYHVARRRGDQPAPFELVFLDVWSDATGTLFALHRCGSDKAEDPHLWEFRHRVVGLDCLPIAAPNLDPIEDATTLH